MTSPASTVAPAAVSRWWRLAVGCTLFVLAMVAVRWDARTGFTSLLRFGETFSARRLPALDGIPVKTFPAHGYDGQFYAQLAVVGDPAAPEAAVALDNARYRARRILLPGLAHILGLGNVRLTLNLYALLNVAAWLALGWRLRRIALPLGAHGPWIWSATMLSLGALESVRLSLTDLPATLLLVTGFELAAAGRRAAAVGLLALGGLTREVALLAAPMLDSGPVATIRIWPHRIRDLILATLPLGLWLWWLNTHVGGDAVGGRNFDWPGVALARHAGACVRALAGGNFDGRFVFGLLAAFSFGYQSLFLVRRWREPSPWVRLGLPFALLFWFLGEQVWHGYWAAARTLLPLTLAFNLSIPRDRFFGWRLAAGNLCLLHGVWRFLP